MLWLYADAHPPHERGGGSAACQCRWPRVHAPKPHEQGAWVLRFVPNGVAVGVDGGKPTSRGLPPAAVLGEGTGSLMGFVGGKHRGSIERPDRETAGVRLGRSRGGLWEPRGKPPRKPANFHDIACPCGTSNIAPALKMPAFPLCSPFPLSIASLPAPFLRAAWRLPGTGVPRQDRRGFICPLPSCLCRSSATALGQAPDEPTQRALKKP